MKLSRILAGAVGVGALSISLGCGGSKPEAPKMPVPMVTVQAPINQEVIQYETFTGRIESTDSVEIRAKVSGYLKKILFTPGKELPKDEPLFEIDQAPFKADLAKAEAEESAAKARVIQFTSEVARLERGRNTGAVTADEYEKAVGAKAEAEANQKAAASRVVTAKLNLGDTTIKAPLAGRIGDKLVSEGNLVMGGQGSTTLLTTILAVDPIQVSFDMDENTLQRLQLAIREGRLKPAKQGEVPVQLGIAIDENRYPHQGVIKFINNTIDPKTGTIRLKAEFPNPKGTGDTRVLAPGMFARVRIPLGEPTKKWLVPDAAIGSDQGTKYLYLVGPENKAMRVDVNAGVLDGTNRVIESVQAVGEAQSRPLTASDVVIVNGLQRVRPGAPVEPKTISKK